MAERATANLGTMFKIFFHNALENMGLGQITTKIHNESDQTIFLIPMRFTHGRDPQPTQRIEKLLAMEIKPGNIGLAKCSQYDEIERTSNVEIQFLFCTAKRLKNPNKFPENFALAEPAKGEELRHHTFLFMERDLYLTVDNDKGKVVEKKKAGQDGESGNNDQARPTFLELVKRVKELEEKVKALAGKVKALTEEAPPIVQE